MEMTSTRATLVDMRAWLDWETAQATGPLLSEDRKAGLAAAAARTRADFKGK